MMDLVSVLLTVVLDRSGARPISFWFTPIDLAKLCYSPRQNLQNKCWQIQSVSLQQNNKVEFFNHISIQLQVIVNGPRHLETIC